MIGRNEIGFFHVEQETAIYIEASTVWLNQDWYFVHLLPYTFVGIIYDTLPFQENREKFCKTFHPFTANAAPIEKSSSLFPQTKCVKSTCQKWGFK